MALFWIPLPCNVPNGRPIMLFAVLYSMLPYQKQLCTIAFTTLKQLWDWNIWWISLGSCFITWIVGRMTYPIYQITLMQLDLEYHNKGWKTRKKKRNTYNGIIPNLAGKYCVFTNLHNVYAENIVYLRPASIEHKSSYANKLIQRWNKSRSSISSFPPAGWPSTILIYVIMTGVLLCNPEIFDSDSDTVIVDNSANCIVWKNKDSFVQGTYRKLADNSIPLIDAVAEAGTPVGVGEVPIEWSDDSGTYHQFILTEVFYVPDSPVNIMGISAFSKIIGDFETKGTRINSSGIHFVFTWDNEKYTRTFVNSDASLPELVVNDGFSRYHRFCNFVEKVFNTDAMSPCYSNKKCHEIV